MPIEQEYYDKLMPVTFTLKDPSDKLVSVDYTTQQGNKLTEYAFLLSANDCAVKNYTSNYLTFNHNKNDVIEHIMPDMLNGTIISKIGFKTTTPGVSAYLAMTSSTPTSASAASLTLSSSSSAIQNFVVDFNTIGNKDVCNVWGYDTFTKKYLFIDESNNNNIIFSPISATSFSYLYDGANSTINLFVTLTSNQFKWFSSNNAGTSLSLISPATGSLSNINFSIVDQNKDIAMYGTDNTVRYLSGIYIDSINTLSGNRDNLLFHTSYESWVPSTSSIIGTIDFFNLKNHVSNNNFDNRYLPLNTKNQRNYTNIITNEYQETANEKLQLGYNFYTKEYLIKSDKYTKFTLPSTIEPFRRININDSGIKESGAYAAESPYFSDRVYKLQDNNINTNNENESNGVLLCAWLKSNGVWYDRYYIPKNSSYITALTSSTPQVFTFKSQLSAFIEMNGLSNTNFYDVQSSLMFEPSATYYYARIGKNYISTTLEGKDANLLRSGFEPFSVLTNSNLLSSDSISLNGSTYDSVSINGSVEGKFNVSFRIKLPNTDITKGYQMVGNNYNTGFAVRKNFYFTPFVILQNNNELYFYDTSFNLIKKNVYDPVIVGNIKDVCYVSQTTDIVLRTSNGLFRTDITGQINYFNTDVAPDVKLSADGRVFYGVGNRAQFLCNGVSYITDLQTLVTQTLTSVSTAKTLVNSSTGIKYLKGSKGTNIDDVYAASLSGSNMIVFTHLNTLTTFNALSTTSTIDDINAYNNNLYVQSGGKLTIFNTARDLLSTINLSTSAVSGFKIDFISENYEIYPIVFSRRSDNNLVVDKISLTTGSILSTYQLPFSSISTGDMFVNPTGYAFSENTYKGYENKLTFTLNLQNTYSSQISSRIWDTFSRSWSATPPVEYWVFSYSTINELTNSSYITALPITDQDNHIDIDFNVLDGLITIYVNGVPSNEISIPANSLSIENILKNTLYIGDQNYMGKSITDYVTNQSFIANNATISDLLVYNITLSRDFIKYLYLKGVDVDDINIDFTSGSRNNIETVDNIFKYNIPGRLSNSIIVYIKSAGISEDSKAILIDILNERLKNTLPVNITDITYNFDIQ